MADKNFMQRMNQVRLAILNSGIAKDRPGYQFKYIDLPQIETKVIEACTANDIFAWISYEGNLASISVYDALHPDAKPFVLSVEPKACDTGKSPIQGTGAMMTYMRRYLYMTAFSISEHDVVDDRQNDSKEDDSKEDDSQEEKEQAPVTEVDPLDEIKSELLIKIRELDREYPQKILKMKNAITFDHVPTEYLEKCLAHLQAKKQNQEAQNA